MSEWITPKTDWVATDFINITDYNRIAGDLNYLRERAREFSHPKPSLQDDGKIYSSMFYASDMNRVEEGIKVVTDSWLQIADAMKTYEANGATPDYIELNRIESRLAECKDMMDRVEANWKTQYLGDSFAYCGVIIA